ncbi:MAG: ABC transporter permease [Rhodospirillaceae bacterium]|nr:ABC transporter permease [Rhodospirillaceae bacterium]
MLASNEAGLACVIVLFAVVFELARGGFFSPFNLYALGRYIAVDMVIGFSMMVVLAVGGMNLAVGSIGVCAAMLGGWAMEDLGLPVPLAVALALAGGAGLGLVNGLAVVRSGVSSFIVTLGTMSVFFGIMIVLTGAESFNQLPAGFVGFGKLRLLRWVPAMLVLAVGVGLVLIGVFRFTALGREMLAVGANPKAAELSGVRVRRAVVTAHVLSGLLAGLAGLLVTTRNGAVLASLAGQIGQDWLLPAFLAPVLGGTLLSGGVVSVAGTMLGAVLVNMLSNGLRQLQVGDFWIELFLGLILLVAVMLDRLRSVYAARRKLVRA